MSQEEISALRARAYDAEALIREEHTATMCLLVPIDQVGRRGGITSPVRMCPPTAPCWWCKADELLSKLPPPERRILFCPHCQIRHVDRGVWATTRVHRKHLCAHCGHVWAPFDFPTVGVEAL